MEDSNYEVEFPNSNYSCFVYDDQYTLQNTDLTEYFYSNFLGFTTDRNSKLTTKKFYDLTDGFATENIDNIDDRLGIKMALRSLMREDVTGIVSPKDFSEKHFEGKLKEKFDKTVVKEFLTPFARDKSLIDKKLQLDRVSIPLRYQLKLEGTTDAIKTHLKIFNAKDKETNSLQTTINTGWEQLIVIAAIPQDE
jgi:hypothetical protein